MKRHGFWITVNGENVHILGDKNMSNEDMEKLIQLIEAAQKMERIDDSSYPQDEGRECSMCGKPNVYGKGDMCSSCQQVWNS